MRLPVNTLKILGINLILIFAVLGVFTTGPFIINRTYRLFRPEVHRRPIIIYQENYPWREAYLDDEEKLEREYKDYVVWSLKPFSGPSMNISQNRIRQTKLSETIEDKNHRYLFFGSSLIMGLGSPDALTIPSFFSEMNRAETVNYGLGGYEARQCLAYLINLHIENKINNKKNTIIFCNGTIEAWNASQTLNFELATPNQSIIRSRLNQPPVLSAAYFLEPALDIMAKIRGKLISPDAPEPIPGDVKKKSVEFTADAVVRSWLIAARLVKEYGDDFIAVLPPSFAVGHPRLKQLPNICSQERMEFIKSVYSLIIEKVEQFPEIKFIDLTDIFDIPIAIYIDQNGHYSPEGNRIFAKQLSKRLHALNTERSTIVLINQNK